MVADYDAGDYSAMVNSLNGKVALVSGAGAVGGIGFAIARSLKELGAEVIITSTTDRIHDRGRELGVKSFVADLTVAQEAAALLGEVENLDIVVNNAGMTSLHNPLESDEAADLTHVTAAGWQRGMARNLDTAFNLTKYSLPLLRRSHAGRIIFVSSITGALMAMENQPVYATSKAAIIGLMKSLAIDEAKYGITSNAVLPGWIGTDTQSILEAEQGMKSPLGRNGRPEEIASLVLYLASEKAGYLTGQAIAVDGGNSIREERA